jgi:membrane-associated phospholipid phosphatase
MVRLGTNCGERCFMWQAIKTHAQGIYEELRQPVFVKRMLWNIGFAIIMVVSIYLNIQFLRTNYPAPPQPPDLLLDLIPRNDLFILIGELFSSLQVGVVLLLFVSARHRFRQLPRLMFLLILMYMIRGFVIVLTPLGQIRPPVEAYAADHFIAQNFYHGMFFSGHTASALIQVMFFHQFTVRWFRRRLHLSYLILPLALVQIVSLLISHQHYTIDIVGGFLIAYFVTQFDFMKIVPPGLRTVKWLPWYTGDQALYAEGVYAADANYASVYERDDEYTSPEAPERQHNPIP